MKYVLGNLNFSKKDTEASTLYINTYTQKAWDLDTVHLYAYVLLCVVKIHFHF